MTAGVNAALLLTVPRGLTLTGPYLTVCTSTTVRLVIAGVSMSIICNFLLPVRIAEVISTDGLGTVRDMAKVITTQN